MSAQKPIIMYDAPEAASLQTVTGWVSSGGRFFGDDENLARYCGATHRRCEVNPEHPIYEVNSSCNECRHDRRQAKFAAMPVKDWPANLWLSSMETAASSMRMTSVTTKVMDEAWRITKMAPLCPHCNNPLLPEDVVGGLANASKALVVAARKRKQTKQLPL